MTVILILAQLALGANVRKNDEASVEIGYATAVAINNLAKHRPDIFVYTKTNELCKALLSGEEIKNKKEAYAACLANTK